MVEAKNKNKIILGLIRQTIKASCLSIKLAHFCVGKNVTNSKAGAKLKQYEKKDQLKSFKGA